MLKKTLQFFSYEFLIWLGITRCSLDCLIRDTSLVTRLVTINHFSMSASELKKSHKIQLLSVKGSGKREDSEKNFWVSLMNGFGEQGGRWKHGTKEQTKNTRGTNLQKNQRSSRRIFCHNLPNVLIFTSVLTYDSHQAADTFIYTPRCALGPKGPFLFTEFIFTPLQSFNHLFHLKQHA